MSKYNAGYRVKAMREGWFGGIRFLKENESIEWQYLGGPDAWLGNIYGPFKTFGEAKKDAIEYFQSDVEHSRAAVREVKRTGKQKEDK